MEFKCQRCGHCCSHLLSTIEGKKAGIYLTPDEVKYFPPESVFPLFRSGNEIFAYQVGRDVCPNLTQDNGRMGCRIYPNRPLLCRSFPATCSDNGLVSLSDKCPSVVPGMTYSDGYRAAKEEIEQSQSTPQATEIFLFDEGKWVTL